MPTAGFECLALSPAPRASDAERVTLAPRRRTSSITKPARVRPRSWGRRPTGIRAGRRRARGRACDRRAPRRIRAGESRRDPSREARLLTQMPRSASRRGRVCLRWRRRRGGVRPALRSCAGSGRPRQRPGRPCVRRRWAGARAGGNSGRRGGCLPWAGWRSRGGGRRCLPAASAGTSAMRPRPGRSPARRVRCRSRRSRGRARRARWRAARAGGAGRRRRAAWVCAARASPAVGRRAETERARRD